MTEEQRKKNLMPPAGHIDAVLDTDTYNEIDDQFALAYMLRSTDKITVRGVLAAPFLNRKSTSPADGMEKSYAEILHVLDLADRQDMQPHVFRGSERYLPDEQTPVDSPAARYLAALAHEYSPERPLYVVAIGAITNVASALLLDPCVRENTVVVWLGGHARHIHDTREFNMMQDYAAARVVMGCGVPFVQLPCMGVVSSFVTCASELSAWMCGRGKLADYLASNTVAYMGGTARPWTKVIWDVTAVGWLHSADKQLMLQRTSSTLLPTYEGQWGEEIPTEMTYVYHIFRDPLFADMLDKICDTPPRA